MNINQKIEERRAALRKERENSQFLAGAIERDGREDSDVSTKSQDNEKDRVPCVKAGDLDEGEKNLISENIQTQRDVGVGPGVGGGVVEGAGKKTEKWDAIVIVIIGAIFMSVSSSLGWIIILFGCYRLIQSLKKKSENKVKLFSGGALGRNSGWFSMGRVLIAIGIFIMIYTRVMSVSLVGSDVVNIHLLSERQNFLMIGLAIFLAGVVWEAVRALKPKSKDPLAKNLSSPASGVMTKAVPDWLSKNIIAASGLINALSTKLYDFVHKKEKKGLQRLVIGILVAGIVYILVESICVSVFYYSLGLMWRDEIVDRVAAWAAIISFFYLFMENPLLVLLSRILLVIVSVIVLTRVLSAIFFGYYGVWMELDGLLIISMLAMFGIRYLLNKKVDHSIVD